MAYSETINLVQGDTLPQLKLTIRDQNTAATGKVLDPDDPSTWKIIDLTGSTMRLKIREVGGSTIKDTVTGELLDPVNGVVIFQFNPTTLDTAGVFEAEVEMTTATNQIQTVYDLIKLQVREQF